MTTPKARILCTEDDPDTRELIKLLLGAEGYEVTTVDNPEDALRLAQTQAFALFLLDNWLPGLSGDELTIKIREFDSRTPILFYSGAAEHSDKESAHGAGAQGYLVKPSGINELIHEVARLISETKIATPVKVIAGTNPSEASRRD